MTTLMMNHQALVETARHNAEMERLERQSTDARVSQMQAQTEATIAQAARDVLLDDAKLRDYQAKNATTWASLGNYRPYLEYSGLSAPEAILGLVDSRLWGMANTLVRAIS